MVEVPGSSPVAPTISRNASGAFREYNSLVPSKGLRLSKSEMTRVKLIDCTVQEMLECGADQFGFTAVARRAQLSTGALYARYENSDELLIDVWNMRAWPALTMFMSDAIEAVTSTNNEKAIQRVIEVMDRQDPDLFAAVALLVVARRNDTVKEVVFTPVQEFFADALTACPAVVHVASFLVGEMLVAKAFGHKTEGWKEFLPTFFQVGAHSVSHSVPPQVQQSFPDTVPTDIDEFDIRLFDALSEVIAAVGVERATVSRIARRANVNPATIYARYSSKNILVARCVEHYLAAVVKGYFALDERVASGDSLIANMVHLFRARNSDKWETVRRFRLESLYAAWHNEELQSVYADAYTAITDHDVRSLSQQSGGSVIGFLNFSTFNRVILFGHSVFFDYALLAPDDELIESIESGAFDILMNH